MKGEIRITGGVYRNHKIIVPKSDVGVRATKVIVRRVLFDILFNYLPTEFTMMDVCAGYGTVGLEALSRNASLVVFCDINRKCLKNIQDNISAMPRNEGKCVLINKSALKITTKGKPMNFIYIDPPYASFKIIRDIVQRLYKYEWIDVNTIIVCEMSSATNFAINELEVFRDRKIGNTILYFCRFIINDNTGSDHSI